MPSFDIKSEIDKHELTNVVDQANRVLKNRFDFKDANAEFKLNDNSILLTANEDFHIKQMSAVLQEAITKRKMDIRILKPGKIEVANNTARQTVDLQEGIDRDLAKKITTLIKQSKLKTQASIQGESIRVTRGVIHGRRGADSLGLAHGPTLSAGAANVRLPSTLPAGTQARPHRPPAPRSLRAGLRGNTADGRAGE